MPITYRLLSACGSGIATSSHVAASIKSGLAERGVAVEIRPCSVTEVEGLISTLKPHAIVSTVSLETVSGLGDIKVVSGVPMLTGIQKGKLLDDLAGYFKQLGT